MATINELKEIRGTIDDLVFYTLNGKQVVRKKSGFSTEAFANNPNYKKVKDNSTEFGHCSKASKMFRTAIAEYIQDCGDKLMYQKFTKVMTNIKNNDTQNEHGKRRIEIGLQYDKSLTILRKFQFGDLKNVEGIAHKEMGLFNESIIVQSTADEAIVLFLEPNFEDYTVHIKQEKHPLHNKKTEIELKDSAPLVFLALKKKGKITHIGFV